MSRYEFALLRYVHDPAAEEFANIGIVMFDVASSRLLVRVTEHYRRLSFFFGSIDPTAYHSMVRHAERSLGRLDDLFRVPNALDAPPVSLDEALRRALPDPDSCIRMSPVMYGVHDEPDHRFVELYHEFVARYDTFAERDRREDNDIRRDFTRKVERSDLRGRVVLDYELHGPNYSHKFAAKWRNGKDQVLDGISFDLLDEHYILEKAVRWSGRLLNLSEGGEFDFTAMVARPSDPKLGPSFAKAVRILEASPNVRDLLLDDEGDRALGLIRDDVAHQQRGSE